MAKDEYDNETIDWVGEEMTYLDYVEKVKKFRDTFGLHQTDPKLHQKLFQEEMRELNAAIEAQDKAQTADGICDAIFIWCGWDLDYGKPADDTSRFFEDMKSIARDAGIYLPAAFEMVYESNMSKLCAGVGEFNQTVEKYKKLGVCIDGIVVGENIIACYAANETDHAPLGKLLKSVGFFEPKWEAKPKRWLI